jgi:6-phosphogluconolactonase
VKTVIASSPSALVEEMTSALVDALELTSHAPFTLALSGGSTPRRFYEALAASALIDWSRLELFFGDERAVPPSHPESNYRMVKEVLLDQVGALAHRMPAEEGDAAGYERLIRSRIPIQGGSVPVFDLVLLGVGPDGHTASLFPGTAELEERERLVTMTAQPHLGTRRMSITLPLINTARRVWVIAAGAEKAEILAQVKDQQGELPIQRVNPTGGEGVWWLDEAAAALCR